MTLGRQIRKPGPIKRMSRIFFTICSFLTTVSAFALTNSQTFTYQGRFLNSGGTEPLLDKVDVIFQIWDPSAACMLYEETQTGVDLTGTGGVISVQVGSTIGDVKRTINDPGLSMADIFSNANTLTNAKTSCSFTPTAAQNRRLRVIVTPYSTMVTTTLSPDQSINSVPQAQTAETLQGLDPSGFIQSASGVAGQQDVNLANLITLTGGGDASALHNHDGRYVKIGTSGSNANLGTGAYTSGSFGINTSNPSADLDFGQGSDRTILVDRNTSASNGNSLSISAGGASTGASNKNGGDLVLSSGVSTGSGGSNISFATSGGGSSGTSDTAATTKMTLTSNGRLGVGQTNPGAQLEVDPSNASTIGLMIKGFASQLADLFEVQNNSGSTVAKITNNGSMTLSGSLTANGYVGIGASSPVRNLQVNGKAVFGTSAEPQPGGSTHMVDIVASGTNSPLMLRGGSGVMEFWKDATPTYAVAYGMAIPGHAIGNDLTFSTFNGAAWAGRLFIQSSTGNVGIGNATSPAQKLQVGTSGDGTVAIANAWNTFSDIRLKKDLSRIPNACSMVNQLNGYYFYWKKGKDRTRQVGVIAQEVEKVLPELVKTGSDGIKTVDYPKLSAVLIEAVKEQQKEIDSLKKRMDALEHRGSAQ